MESDFCFRFEHAKVFRGMAGLAPRLAVLRPLFGPVTGAQAIVEQTRHCMAAWRARASALVAVNARCSRHPKWLQRARNCTPAFVYGVGGGRSECSTRLICPFCYARSVYALWPTVSSSFDWCFDREPDTSLFWLLVRRRATRIEIPTHDAARAVYAGVVKKRRELVTHYRPLGGYACVRVEPTRTPGTWLFHHRMLLKVPAGTRALPPEPHEYVDIYPNVTRQLLCTALARVCRYPRTYMRAPAEAVAAILNTQAGFRVKTSTLIGDFRRDPDFEEDS